MEKNEHEMDYNKVYNRVIFSVDNDVEHDIVKLLCEKGIHFVKYNDPCSAYVGETLICQDMVDPININNRPELEIWNDYVPELAIDPDTLKGFISVDERIINDPMTYKMINKINSL